MKTDTMTDQPEPDRFKVGDLIRSKHERLAAPCLVLAINTGGNSNIITVHDPESGVRPVTAFDFTLARAGDAGTAAEAELRIRETLASARSSDPLTEYRVRSKIGR